MKRRLRFCFLALALATPFSRYATRPAPADDKENAASSCVSVSYVDYYVGSNARWIVDRQEGSVSAWERERPVPLWSSDGVVFRLSSRRNAAPVRLSATSSADSFAPTTEFFGRAYFFLNDAPRSRSENALSPFVRRDDLLLALDLRAQGRLVWKRRARDFADFFASDVSSLRFLPRLEILSNDKLLAFVQGDQEVKRFAIDAADGTFRLLDALSQSK